jgi:hypothetical protein
MGGGQGPGLLCFPSVTLIAGLQWPAFCRSRDMAFKYAAIREAEPGWYPATQYLSREPSDRRRTGPFSRPSGTACMGHCPAPGRSAGTAHRPPDPGLRRVAPSEPRLRQASAGCCNQRAARMLTGELPISWGGCGPGCLIALRVAHQAVRSIAPSPSKFPAMPAVAACSQGLATTSAQRTVTGSAILSRRRP